MDDNTVKHLWAFRKVNEALIEVHILARYPKNQNSVDFIDTQAMFPYTCFMMSRVLSIHLWHRRLGRGWHEFWRRGQCVHYGFSLS